MMKMRKPIVPPSNEVIANNV